MRLPASAASASPRRPLATPVSTSPVPSGFVRKGVPRSRARLPPEQVRVGDADDGEPVLRLRVADRVPAGKHRAGLVRLGRRGVEDRPNGLDREAPRETPQSRARAAAAHRRNVVQRVRRRDGAEERRSSTMGRKKSVVKMRRRAPRPAYRRPRRRRDRDRAGRFSRTPGAKPAKSSSSRRAAEYFAAQPPPASRAASRAVVSIRWRLAPSRPGGARA